MKRPELTALTGLRFYAALLVFFSHVTILPGMERYSGSSLLFNAGVAGVGCFFVLSGFILTYNYAPLFHGHVAARDYGRFVWERWTRIYPVHLAMLLFMIPLQLRSPHLPLDWRAVPFHLFLVQCWWPAALPRFSQYLNVPSWSISCEWFFYLLAPSLMYFVAGRRRRWIAVLVMAGYACGLFFAIRGEPEYTRLHMVSWFAPSRTPEFLAGVFVAQYFLHDKARTMARYSGLLQMAGIGVFAAGACYRAQAPWPLWGGLLYVPGAALTIMGLAYGRGLLAAHLSGPLLNRLGTASFCLYMMQAPALRAMKAVWAMRGWEVRSAGQFLTVVMAMFALVQGAAFIMHKYYEVPSRRYLRLLPEISHLLYGAAGTDPYAGRRRGRSVGAESS